ncbi:MAG: hypothetical protein IPK16_15735 [Anaerolineales bacterium]|nr:hypothetical protein [Anaerolineales bacterium]
MARDNSERFPRVVASLAELPAPFATALDACLEGPDRPTVILFVPRVALLGVQRGWRAWVLQLLPWHMSPEMVLVRTRTHLIVATAQSAGATPVVTRISPADLISIELGWVLLLAWFKLQCAGESGVAGTTIYFNSVGIEHFRRLLFDLNGASAPQAQLETGACDRSALDDMPFKFKNIIGQRLMTRAERIEAVVFRPPVRKSAFRLSRYLPGLALVLTDARLLIASEDEGSTHQTTSYGMNALYIPRKRIQGWRMTSLNDQCTLELHYGLRDAGAMLSLNFPGQLSEEITGLMRRICPQQPATPGLAAAALVTNGTATLR